MQTKRAIQKRVVLSWLLRDRWRGEKSLPMLGHWALAAVLARVARGTWRTFSAPKTASHLVVELVDPQDAQADAQACCFALEQPSPGRVFATCLWRCCIGT